jgi:hypothetical protein
MQTEINQYCCGVFDVDGACDAVSANSAKQFVAEVLNSEAFFNDGERQLPAHLIFTQASYRSKATTGYGFRIAKCIRDHELGTVTISNPGKNPRTENHITVFVWTPNAKANKLAEKFYDSQDDRDVKF